MQIFVAALIGALVSAAGSLIGRILIALGIGVVSYTGVSALLSSLRSEVQGYITGMPADILPILGALKLDVAVSIIFSAIAARFALQGLTSGAVKKFVLK